MKSKIKLSLAKIVALTLGLSVAGLSSYSAQAASATWTGATDAVWADANWGGISPVPGTGDTATFNASSATVNANTTISLGTGVTINTILFDTANAAAYTIGAGAVGSQTLTLNNGGAVTMNSTVANNETVNAALVLGTDGTAQTFTLTNNSTTNGLTLAGGITGSTGAGVKTLAVAGAGNTTLSGIIGNGTTGSVALTQSGSGTLTLSGVNTYTGTTTISAGTLKNGSATTFTNKGTLTLNGTGTFDLGGFNAGFTSLAGTSVATNTITNSGSSDATLNFSATTGGVSYAGLITDGATNKTAISLANANDIPQFTNTGNTFSGGLTLLNGTGSGTRLYINTALAFTGTPGALTSSNFGTGTITIGTTSTNKAGIRFDSGASGTLANAIVFNTALGTDRVGITTTSANTITLAGAITANSTAAFGANSGTTLSVTGAISGSGGVSMGGNAADTGTITLSGTNTYAGVTTITRGTIDFIKQVSLYNATTTSWTPTNLSVASGGVLALGVGDSASGYFDSAAIATFMDGTHMGLSTTTTGFKTGALLGFDTTNATGGTYTYNTNLTNIGTSTTNGFSKIGTGALFLGGNNTYTGNTTAVGGILVLSGANSNGASATTTVSTGATLQLQANNGNTSNFTTASTALGTASGKLALNDGSTLQLRSDTSVTFSGTDGLPGMNAKTITIDVNNITAGTANGTTNGGAQNQTLSLTTATTGLGTTGQFNITGGNGYTLAFGPLATANGTGQTWTFNPTSASVTIASYNNAVGASNTLALAGTSTGNAVLGAIANSTGTLAVTKSGTSTWTLSGANTYTGATNITAGKLRITNTTGSGTGTGTVGLSGGTSTTLSGTGFSTGALTVTNASRLAPGVNTSGANSNFGVAGTLSLGTTGGMTLTSANFDFDLAGTAATAGGGVNDLIATGGALSLTTTEAFTFNEMDGALLTGTAYTLISGAASANTGVDTSGWITSTSFLNGSSYTPTYSFSGNNLQVTFALVPEPGTWAMLLTGFGWLGVWQRRNYRGQA